jgi:hypothetical protein
MIHAHFPSIAYSKSLNFFQETQCKGCADLTQLLVIGALFQPYLMSWVLVMMRLCLLMSAPLL